MAMAADPHGLQAPRIPAMTTISDLFLEFDNAISLARRQRERLDSAASNVQQFLSRTYDLPANEVFLQGSYPNHTAIEPVDNGEYDLDIVAVCADDGATADQALADLTRTFRGDGRFSKRIVPKKPCVRLDYAEDEIGKFHVDVVPARRSDSQAPLDAPRKGDGWHPTAPAEYTQWCTDQGDRYASTVRAMKRWRDENQNVRTAVKSIVLQVLVAQTMPGIPDQDLRFAETLHGLHRLLSTHASPPRVENPVLATENLAARWAAESFTDFKVALRYAVEVADQALASNDLAEAADKWREILGDDFPTPSKTDLGIRLSDISHVETPESKGWTRSVNPRYRISISATVQRGQRSQERKRLESDSRLLFAGKKIRFTALVEAPNEAEVWWQVVNTGGHARDDRGLRGTIFRAKKLDGMPNPDERENWEDTKYTGSHLIRAIAVAAGTVVAESDWFTVNIYATGHRFRP